MGENRWIKTREGRKMETGQICEVLEKWPICAKHCGGKDEKWGTDWGRERNLIYWKYYKLHLCITPQNYQPIKAECLLLSHYMEIRSHSESVSMEGGEERRKSQSEGDGEERSCSRGNRKCTIMQAGKRRCAVINKIFKQWFCHQQQTEK